LESIKEVEEASESYKGRSYKWTHCVIY
jgi:hypothetical protein